MPILILLSLCLLSLHHRPMVSPHPHPFPSLCLGRGLIPLSPQSGSLHRPDHSVYPQHCSCHGNVTVYECVRYCWRIGCRGLDAFQSNPLLGCVSHPPSGKSRESGRRRVPPVGADDVFMLRCLESLLHSGTTDGVSVYLCSSVRLTHLLQKCSLMFLILEMYFYLISDEPFITQFYFN